MNLCGGSAAGFDLTPFYPFDDDVRHWHTVAREICEPYGADVYPHYKKWCDDYFYLKHRNETRGVGGLFYDDLNEGGFERCFALTQAVGRVFSTRINLSSSAERTFPMANESENFSYIAAVAM